jgi:hypothetical protein
MSILFFQQPWTWRSIEFPWTWRQGGVVSSLPADLALLDLAEICTCQSPGFLERARLPK